MKTWPEIKAEAAERLRLKIILKHQYGIDREVTSKLSITELKELIKKQNPLTN